jgi:hypothetical protein
MDACVLSFPGIETEKIFGLNTVCLICVTGPEKILNQNISPRKYCQGNKIYGTMYQCD